MGQIRDRMLAEMELRGLSVRTQDTYLVCCRNYVRHYMKSPEQLGAAETKGFDQSGAGANAGTDHPDEVLSRGLHYGLVAAANVATKLEAARRCLIASPPTPPPSRIAPPPTWQEMLLLLTGIDVLLCPVCHHRSIERHPLPHRPPDTS